MPFVSAELLELARSWLELARSWLELARSWYEILLPDPGTAVTDFMAQITSGRLSNLVRNPLMPTMLCQLYAADPAKPLPSGRYGLYEAFVDLLREHQATTSALSARILHVVPRLAAVRLAGDTTPALDLIGQWTSDLRPAETRRAAWGEAVRAGLRRGGPMTEQSGDFAFLHQTIADFLAARYAATDAHCSEAEFRRPVRSARRRRWRSCQPTLR